MPGVPRPLASETMTPDALRAELAAAPARDNALWRAIGSRDGGDMALRVSGAPWRPAPGADGNGGIGAGGARGHLRPAVCQVRCGGLAPLAFARKIDAELFAESNLEFVRGTRCDQHRNETIRSFALPESRGGDGLHPHAPLFVSLGVGMGFNSTRFGNPQNRRYLERREDAAVAVSDWPDRALRSSY
jgi:hypothetical protein